MISELYEIFKKHPRICTDSRKVEKGCIFFALRGESFDGNLYAAKAIESGAAYAVVDDVSFKKSFDGDQSYKIFDATPKSSIDNSMECPIANLLVNENLVEHPSSDQGRLVNNEESLLGRKKGVKVDNPPLSYGERFVVVDDVLRALQELAAEHRLRLGIPIVALTGSNGKTTTKEFLVRVLGTKFRVGATVGNLNNHIGVPLTLLSFDDTTEIGIVEMGANHCHEIEMLCEIARPDVGLITNVGRAHLEGFGGVEGVRRGKGEMFDFLQRSGGLAIYNRADLTLSGMVMERVGLKNIAYDPYLEPLEMSIYGEYNQLNAQAAFAVGKYFGVDTVKARQAIKNYTPENNRSQIIKTEFNTLYLDAYNANPSSMKAAIENFLELDEPHKIVILGEMRELGDYSDEEHAAVVGALGGRFESVILVGPNYAKSLEASDKGYEYFKEVAGLSDFLKINRLKNKHILVKGSRGVALERIVELL